MSIVSIVIPIYNKEKQLKRCLESIRSQTFQDFEVLLIDDGSTDKSEAIAKQYVKTDRRFRYYYQSNSGPSVARNVGIDNATGEWISFVDPDDYIDKSMLEKLLQSSCEADVIACCCKTVQKKGIVVNHFFKNDRVFKDTFSDKKELMLRLMALNYDFPDNITGIGVPWGKLYARNFLLANRLRFEPELKRMQDNVFNMKAFELADKIVYIDQDLYYYDCENIECIGKKYDPKTVEYYSKIINIRSNFLRERNYFSDSILRRAFNVEVFSITEMIMSRVYFNKAYKGNRDLDFAAFIKKEHLMDYLTKVKYKDLKTYRKRIKLFLLKHKMFFALTFLYLG